MPRLVRYQGAIVHQHQLPLIAYPLLCLAAGSRGYNGTKPPFGG